MIPTTTTHRSIHHLPPAAVVTCPLVILFPSVSNHLPHLPVGVLPSLILPLVIPTTSYIECQFHSLNSGGITVEKSDFIEDR